jgi:serine protease Do
MMILLLCIALCSCDVVRVTFNDFLGDEESIISFENIESVTSGILTDTEEAESRELVTIEKSESIKENNGGVTSAGQAYNSVSEVYYAVCDSVVEITTETVQTSAWMGQYISTGAGSGVIIGKYSVEGTPSGYYIVTNAHVIQNSNGGIVEATGITVTTNTGKEYPVHKVMGYDIIGDLAVLMVQTSDKLPVAPIGDSDTLIIGEEVVAIGNPLGELGGTVTNGIISALDREIDVDGNKMNLLQTNAAINPGNSGGGLFNLRGELIGVVNAKSSGSGIEGLGFAIPSKDVESMVNDIIEFGYVKGRPYVGITVATDNYSRVYVYSLEKNYNDGVLQVHDQLLEANGNPIKSNKDFNAVIQGCKPGDTIELTIKRNRSTITVTITVFEKKFVS